MLPQRSEFEAQISTAMSAISGNNAAVEAAFHGLIEACPDFLALHFVASLSLPTTPADNRASQAAILRQLLSRGSPLALWSRLSAAAKDTVKSCLLRALKFASDSRDIWGTVTELAAQLLPDPGSRWDELIVFLIDAASCPIPAVQESALLVLTQVNVAETFDDYSNCIIAVLERCLQNTLSANVRIAALGATANIAHSLATNEGREKLQCLLPFMANVLVDCSSPINEAPANVALNLLFRLYCTDATFLEPCVEDLVVGILQIAESERAKCPTKTLAVEFLVHVAERAGFLMKLERTRGTAPQLPKFMDRLVKVLMLMLTDVEDNNIWQIAESRDGDVAELNGYCLAQPGLHRLANAFGDSLAPIAAIFLKEYFSAPQLEWKKHCAALIALAQISKGCAKVMLQSLDGMVPIILGEFKHPHPRVQWAAISAIGQLCTDLGPNLQVQYHQLIIPALVNAVIDSQSPLVQEHAAGIILFFSKKCSNAVLTQHVTRICSQLIVFVIRKQVAGGELLPSSDSVATAPSPPPPPTPPAAATEAIDQVVQVAQPSAAEQAQPQEPVNQHQDMLPMKGDARVAFLKALSTAAVTTTASGESRT